jgi:hypothetical protein
LSGSSIYEWVIGSNAQSLTQVTGNLDFGSSAVLDVYEFGSTLPQPGVYPLFTVAGTLGSQPTWTYDLPSQWSGSVTEVGNVVELNLTTTPEPSTFVLMVVGAIGLLGYGMLERKRKHSSSLVCDPTHSDDDETNLEVDGPAILSLPFRWTEAARRAA